MGNFNVSVFYCLLVYFLKDAENNIEGGSGQRFEKLVFYILNN